MLLLMLKGKGLVRVFNRRVCLFAAAFDISYRYSSEITEATTIFTGLSFLDKGY